MAERRLVALTGLGAITPLGHNLETTYQALLDGKRAIKNERPWIEQSLVNAGAEVYIPRFTTHLAALVHDFDFLSDPALANRIKPRNVDRYYSTAAQFFIAAAIEAARQAEVMNDELFITGVEELRAAVVVGTGIGGAAEIPGFAFELVKGNQIPPTSMPKSQPDNPMVMASMLFRARGPNNTLIKACSSGNAAVAHAVRLIENDEADLVIAGGTDGLNPTVIAEFEATTAGSESEDPNDAPWPFRAIEADDPGGAVLSEGAGVGVFEPYERALARGAFVFALVTGYGETSDAYDPTMLSGEGTEESMRLALRRANVSRKLALLFNPHATSAGRAKLKRVGDQVEARATLNVFSGKNEDYDPEQIKGKVFPTKGPLGHAVGGANGIEFVVTAKIMHEGKMPPTGLDSVLTDPDMSDFVPTTSEATDVEVDGFLSNGMGFGGSNATIVAVKPPEAA